MFVFGASSHSGTAPEFGLHGDPDCVAVAHRNCVVDADRDEHGAADHCDVDVTLRPDERDDRDTDDRVGVED